MDTWVLVAIAAAALVIVAVVIALWVYFRARRTAELREQFGSEYDRTVGDMGRGAGEKELQQRWERVKVLEIRPLNRDEYQRFTHSWTATQAHFVDDPSLAIREADELVAAVIEARGYPVDDDFDQRAADISVDHPEVVAHYRNARDTASRHQKGDATTEELRIAMTRYRALFADLLETERESPREPGRQAAFPGRS